MMECIYCKGKMVKKSIPFQVYRKGYYLTLNSVPAWVCPQCGEPYFEETEVDAIQHALKMLDKEIERIISTHRKVVKTA